MSEYSVGFAYHISDRYFAFVNDPTLMTNKEDGCYRPHFFCFRDFSTPDLIWAVPLSSKVEKYQEIRNKKIERYGSCCTIVLGDFAGRPCAFLVQNMFPLTERYIDHVHTVENRPVALHPTLVGEIQANAKLALNLSKRGSKIIFTDIPRLKALMLSELQE